MIALCALQSSKLALAKITMTDPNLTTAKKKITCIASPQGIERAEKALVRLGFESKMNFAKSQLLSRSTVTNFFQRKPIQPDSFKSICKALKLELENILMHEDPAFAKEIKEGEKQNNSTMTQIIQDNAKGWQTKVEGAIAYIGENTIHQAPNS